MEFFNEQRLRIMNNKRIIKTNKKLKDLGMWSILQLYFLPFEISHS